MVNLPGTTSPASCTSYSNTQYSTDNGGTWNALGTFPSFLTYIAATSQYKIHHDLSNTAATAATNALIGAYQIKVIQTHTGATSNLNPTDAQRTYSAIFSGDASGISHGKGKLDSD